jgi:DNA-binding transcriptional LysR family regulator
MHLDGARSSAADSAAMRAPRLSGIDANLLIALDALLTERSVTRASKRHGISQPAMSHALAQLRAHFKDPLLVARGRSLEPTSFAERLHPSVSEAVHALGNVLALSDADSPSNRTFVIASTDYFAARFMPAILRSLQDDVPNVAVELRSLLSRSTERILADGVSLAFGVFEDVPPQINQQFLFLDSFACVVRRDHPVSRSGLNLESYLALPHLEVVPTPGARPGERVDRWLAAKGMRRHVTVRVAHYLAAARILETSDHILTVAKGAAEALARGAKLRILPAPLDLMPFRFSQIWRAQHDSDRVHRWLRETVAKVCMSSAIGPPLASTVRVRHRSPKHGRPGES